MSSNKGLYRASLRELHAFADGQARRVRSFAYDAADGMVNRECNGSSQVGWKMPDGTLRFAGLRGVVVVDPARRNDAPPRVRVEEARVDGQALALDAPPRLRPGQDNLEVQYTALSWQRPQAVRFEYRLAGLSREWTDAGARRTAYFSRLPPGEYRFEVRADNGDGVWSPEAAALAFVVLPPFWQTWWFLAAAAGAGATLLGGAFRWRGRQLRRRFAQQQDFSRRLIDAHESERRRIAAELHDGLGQTLAMIKNSALLGTNKAGDPDAARAQLAQITEQSTQAIREVREIAHNLRPYLLDRLGLTKALRSLLNKTAEHTSLGITAEIEDLDGCFSREAEMSLYRIVQESLGNVLKHAQATEVLVRIRAGEGAVDLVVQDDGKGFKADGPAAPGEPRGFGLLGLAERVRLLGGTFTLQSKPGEGTTLAIQLPRTIVSTPTAR